MPKNRITWYSFRLRTGIRSTKETKTAIFPQSESTQRNHMRTVTYLLDGKCWKWDLKNARKNTFSSIRKHTNAKATKWNLLAESIPANTTKSIPKAYIILASKPAQNNSLSQAVRSFANRFRLTARKDTLKI